ARGGAGTSTTRTPDTTMHNYTRGPIAAGGAFTGDFGIAPGAPVDQVPAFIETDREVMAARPGMRQKHVPITVDEAGRPFCGGRYLFDTWENAEDYRRWVTEEFVVDGVPFPERPLFVDPVFLSWRVAGAHDFRPVEEHRAVRFERWALAPEVTEDQLTALWDRVRAAADRRGLASAWLLWSDERREAGLVTVAGSADSRRSAELDPELLDLLEGPDAVGKIVEQRGTGTRVFDRTGWVWTLWLPLAGAGEPPSLWPNSPPLPAPVAAEV
ncbi:MAG TPA: hypothetical protein VHG51_20505, partial [Longimicrobiaceae bacterium]|nr:hypothetical protein [Longimicrobiaceae bacterium]